MFRRLAFYVLIPVLLLSAAPVFADPPPPPPNDNFADAMPLDDSVSAHGVFTNARTATMEAGEPTCAASNSVWYTFTLDHRSEVLLYGNFFWSDVPLPTTYTVGLYRDGATLTEVACVHNHFRRFAVTRKSLAAGTYYIQVGVRAETVLPEALYYLAVEFPPENDDFADAAVLTPGSQWVGALLATTEAVSDSHGSRDCGGTLYHTVWYTFTLDVPTTLDLKLDGHLYILNAIEGYLDPYAPFIDLWRKSGSGRTPLACEESSGLTLGIRRTLDPGTYYVRLASKVSVVKKRPSAYYLTTVFEPPGLAAIYDQPDHDLRVGDGESATLSVAAASSLPLTYQWYKIDSLWDVGDTSNPVAGATGPILTTGALGVGFNYYWVRISNADGVRDSGIGQVHVVASVQRTELIENGGFEDGNTGWTLRNSTGDSAACEDGSTPPQGKDSPCAFVFKGGTGENSVLEQSHKVAAGGDSLLEFSFWMKNTGAAGKLHVKLHIKPDGLPNTVLKLTYWPNGTYTRLSSVINWGSSAYRWKVQFIHSSSGGKTLIDDVSLVAARSTLRSAQPDVLPPPPAPVGFRSGD